jgi:hypothetical protein
MTNIAAKLNSLRGCIDRLDPGNLRGSGPDAQEASDLCDAIEEALNETKKVYCIIQDLGYEGEQLISIQSNKEVAIGLAKGLGKYHEVEEWEINSEHTGGKGIWHSDNI